jgi:hypothetical protein
MRGQAFGFRFQQAIPHISRVSKTKALDSPQNGFLFPILSGTTGKNVASKKFKRENLWAFVKLKLFL